MMKNWMILLAGGRGIRCELGFNKVLADLGGFPMFYWPLIVFERHPNVDEIIISANSEEIGIFSNLIDRLSIQKVNRIVMAEQTRKASVSLILESIPFKADDIIGIHNAANPFIKSQELSQLFKIMTSADACIAAHHATDSIKVSNEFAESMMTLDKTLLWHAQTPQMSRFRHLKHAFIHQIEDKSVFDEAELLEHIGIYPKILETSRFNFKITTIHDLLFARFLIENGWYYD